MDNMAEKETEFPKKSVIAAATLIGVAGASYLAGQALEQGHNQAAAQELYEHGQEAQQAYHDSIEQAINAHYDSKAKVGEIQVQQGDTLGDAGLKIVEHALGTDVYNDIKARIYDPLIDSAKQYDPQVDIDPAANNGNEYIIVTPDHVIQTDATAIPTPETH